MPEKTVTVTALTDIPRVQPGDDIIAMLEHSTRGRGLTPQAGDVLDKQLLYMNEPDGMGGRVFVDRTAGFGIRDDRVGEAHFKCFPRRVLPAHVPDLTRLLLADDAAMFCVPERQWIQRGQQP